MNNARPGLSASAARSASVQAAGAIEAYTCGRHSRPRCRVRKTPKMAVINLSRGYEEKSEVRGFQRTRTNGATQ